MKIRWSKYSRFWRAMEGMLAALLTLMCALTLVATTAHAAAATITPAGTWNDNRGTLIQAHGGGITRVGSTYYWFGEDKNGESSSNAAFQNVPCYSSTDLAHWTFVSNVLTRQASGDLGPNRVVERPKVIFNSTTNQYVMYMHIDNSSYGEAKVGVATSSSICGAYSYRGSFQPLGFQSRDMNLFKDDDGTAYLLSEDRANGLRIDRLSADYLSVASSVALLTPNHEAPAMIKFNGRYYLFGSLLTGWNTNNNQYTTATSLAGPWSSWSIFAPPGSNTLNSQTTFILPIAGSSGTTFMYMGDRWTPSNLGTSPYIWLPLQVNGANATMSWHTNWSIDTATGQWTDNSSTNYDIISRNSSLLLDVNSSSTSAGAQVIQWTNNNGANQQWTLVSAGNGFFTIVNKHSGLPLDVTGASTTAGANVIQGAKGGGTSQQWSLVAASGGYYTIVNRNSGLLLDVNGASTTAGANVIQWTSTGGSNQQWLVNSL
ncbi:MAG TPA: RICIN domain-containing protein [Ktedonobacteraceae bacterium]|nr:RICIN domain-containing protein [Ktedonobacteraceae bacterium]